MSQPSSRPPLYVALALILASAAPRAAQSWRSDDGAELELPAGQARLEQGADEAGRRRTFARMDEVDWSGWKDLSGLLRDVHRRVGVPAIAAAFVRDGKLVAGATVGVQAFDSELAVAPDARFHLGSVTKSFTAVVLAKLVEEGKLDWDTRVDAVLTDIEMRAAYRAVTVEQLLQHRGGLPGYTDRRPEGHDPDKQYAGSPTEQRAAFLADVLVQDPVGTPGETGLYSNAGYTVAGHMAERVSGQSWEQLVRLFVFEPLGMQSGGFGFPDQPMGHAGNGPEFLPVPIEAYPPMEIIAPAGNVHASVSDLARYANAHLTGLGGQDGLLRAATVQRLHTVAGGRAAGQYASGWIVDSDPTGDPVHRHGGTVGASYAEIRLYPERNCATIVLTTVSLGPGEALANQVARAMLQRYAPRMSGFVSAKGQTSNDIRLVEGKSTAEEDTQLWKVVRKMSQAINDEDRKAYHALFAPGYDQRNIDSMFDFMARNVLPSRGGLYAFHAASPPMKVGGSDLPVRAVTFHLENGFPGYYGFSLNEKREIVEFSLFVKGDMCPNGTDRRCAKIAKTLEELE